METDKAVEHNEKALKQMLYNLHLDVRELMVPDFDQVLWDVVSIASDLASAISSTLTPESREE